MWPGFDSRTRRQMWVEFVVGSRPCSERFFSGYSGFPLTSKTKHFQIAIDSEKPREGRANYYIISMYVFLFYFSLFIDLHPGELFS